MIISCDQWLKKFEIESSLIPDSGRLLQCSSCHHKWFYKNVITQKTEVVSHPKLPLEDKPETIIEKSDNINTLRSYIDNQELSIYSNFIIDCLFEANKYFNDQEPWKKKSDVVRLNTIVYVSLEIIRKVSILLNPIIPDTSLKVLDIFNLKQKDINFDTIKDNKFLKPNSNIKKIGILFKKIDKNDWFPLSSRSWADV